MFGRELLNRRPPVSWGGLLFFRQRHIFSSRTSLQESQTSSRTRNSRGEEAICRPLRGKKHREVSDILGISLKICRFAFEDKCVFSLLRRIATEGSGAFRKTHQDLIHALHRSHRSHQRPHRFARIDRNKRHPFRSTPRCPLCYGRTSRQRRERKQNARPFRPRKQWLSVGERDRHGHQLRPRRRQEGR